MTPGMANLTGAIDMQTHTGPDIRSRVLDDDGLAESCAASGFAGAVLKGHRDPTTARAIAVNTRVPGVTLYGSVVLNRNVGGLNPHAVEAMPVFGKEIGRIVWLPTVDADFHLKRKGIDTPGLVAVDRDGRFQEGLDDVLRAVAAHDLILGSGHVGPAETVAVFKRARDLGCRRLVATHVTSDITTFDDSQMKAVVELGGYLEVCAWSVLKHPGGAPKAEAAVENTLCLMRKFGTAQMILSSDLGKTDYPSPIDGLRMVAYLLSAKGASPSQLEDMCVRNPRDLLGPGAGAA